MVSDKEVTMKDSRNTRLKGDEHPLVRLVLAVTMKDSRDTRLKVHIVAKLSTLGRLQ